MSTFVETVIQKGCLAALSINTCKNFNNKSKFIYGFPAIYSQTLSIMGHSLFSIFLKMFDHEIPNGKCYAKLDGYFVDMMDHKIDKIF